MERAAALLRASCGLEVRLLNQLSKKFVVWFGLVWFGLVWRFVFVLGAAAVAFNKFQGF